MGATFRPPTERQVEIMVAMLELYETGGDWPTQRELCAAAGVRSASMLPYYDALIKKGLARRIPDRSSRNFALTDLGWDFARGVRRPGLS